MECSVGFNIGKVGAVCSTFGGVGEGGGGVPISDNYGHEHAVTAFVCSLLCQGASTSCLLEKAAFLMTWAVHFTWIQCVLLSTPLG